MLINFTLTKEYEIFIDKEDIDNCYGGDVEEAISENMSEAKEVDSRDIEVLDTDLDSQDILYEKSLQDEYEDEKELQSSQYYRDLI